VLQNLEFPFLPFRISLTATHVMYFTVYNLYAESDPFL